MGQKEMGTGRQQDWDTKAKTHRAPRGDRWGQGMETAGEYWEGRGFITGHWERMGMGMRMGGGG